jgi:hypothetical protein
VAVAGGSSGKHGTAAAVALTGCHWQWHCRAGWPAPPAGPRPRPGRPAIMMAASALPLPVAARGYPGLPLAGVAPGGAFCRSAQCSATGTSGSVRREQKSKEQKGMEEGAGNPAPPMLGGGAQTLPATLPAFAGFSFAPPALLEGNSAAGLAGSATPAQTSAPAASPAKRLCLAAPPSVVASSGASLPSSLSELNAALCTLFALPRRLTRAS